jgi:hypothetical protein
MNRAFRFPFSASPLYSIYCSVKKKTKQINHIFYQYKFSTAIYYWFSFCFSIPSQCVYHHFQFNHFNSFPIYFFLSSNNVISKNIGTNLARQKMKRLIKNTTQLFGASEKIRSFCVIWMALCLHAQYCPFFLLLNAINHVQCLQLVEREGLNFNYVHRIYWADSGKLIPHPTFLKC